MTHLCAIHQYIFGDIYSFAGKLRREDISKGETRFCNALYIKDELTKLLKTLKEEQYLLNLDQEAKWARLAYYMAELNIIHPFREGNGRTIREFIRVLALKNGLSLDWSRVSHEVLLEASVRSVFNSEALEACLIACSGE